MAQLYGKYAQNDRVLESLDLQLRKLQGDLYSLRRRQTCIKEKQTELDGEWHRLERAIEEKQADYCIIQRLIEERGI